MFAVIRFSVMLWPNGQCQAIGDPALRSAAIAEEITRRAERIKRNTRPSATTISGHPDPVNQTAPAATKTERFDAMSFREHSHTELMFTSSWRWRHSIKRQREFAARPK